MYLLEQLWRGNIAPSERYIRSNSEYKKASVAFCDAAEKMEKELTAEGKQLWREVANLQSDMNVLAEEDIFIYGFRMGARMILDVVGDYKGQFYEVSEAG